MIIMTFDLNEEVIRTNYTQEVMLHIFDDAVDDDDDDGADDGDEDDKEDEEQDENDDDDT